MDPRPHTYVLPQNNSIWIEISGPTSLQDMRYIIPSSLLYIKVINFLYSGKLDNGLLFAPLNKNVMPLLSTLLRVNIEESPRIPYLFNYGEDFFILLHG